jgi:NAD(P)-dependent dehydrogenase (short-subunit alcohol dehydrogenase family)
MNLTKLFGPNSTTNEVLTGVDLRGKRVLVTGVSAGLGIETARTLAVHGAHVVCAARDLAKAEAATRTIRADAATRGGLELIELDLASLANVRACAEELVTRAEPFDLVVANAGVMACPFALTADGFETQFGTNHLGHFVLVNRIASLMRSGARFVSLASSAHRIADVSLQDPNFEHTPYDKIVAYGRSKTANVLFAVEFDRRHKHRDIRAAAVHPGGTQTELLRHTDFAQLQLMVDHINAINAAKGEPPHRWKTIPQGAATSVWAGAVAAADEVGGRYCEDCHIGEVVEGTGLSPVDAGVVAYALDSDHAKRLWAKSEEMVGERF